ncbi:MAG: Ribonuclease BN-like family protein [Syntrophorhabdus sp. PtaU1.Bin050]|nr:MAG: Ribonuclease BN-like family protein [Syntrophorhabdus sp. PtaU1.Bin050]
MARKRKTGSVFGVVKALFTKYQKDHGNILVSSISFYVLLTFVPFTLLSIFILGNVIDLSNPGLHLEKYLKNIVPDPYNTVIVKKILKELNLISLSKRLSGPLGLLFLFFFTVRLFGIIRSSFQIIFSKVSKGFIRGKGEELLLTLLFSLVQTMLFFSFVFRLVVQTKIISLLPAFFGKAPVIFIFSLLDMAVVFVMFFLLYWFLTPTRNKRVVLICTTFATFSWYAGKYFFEYFIIHIGKVTAFFGTYGVFIAFLFWVYFSVFTFVVGAELLSIIGPSSSRAPQPSYVPFRGSPSRARRG